MKLALGFSSFLICTISFSFGKPMDVQEIVFDKEIWKSSLEDFHNKHKDHGFKFMTAEKKGTRSEGREFKFLDKNAGEVVVRDVKGKVGSVNISLYNRGDDRPISYAQFASTFTTVTNAISKKTGSKPEDISKKGTVTLTRKLWKWGDSAILLEASTSKNRSGGKEPEFMRIRMKSLSENSSGMRNRSALDDSLVKDRATGDIYIQNVPMIDQGRKGYCAVASAARVYRYYGLDIDQHELAQIAGTGPNTGTSLGEMVAALKKATRHVNSRVLVLYEYPKGTADKMPGMDATNSQWNRVYRNYELGLKEFARDVKKYNQTAKKLGKETFPDDPKTGVINEAFFFMKCDPEIYRDVMVKKSSYGRFKSKIEEYIDQGIPVGWCLMLGMFKEGNLPQSFGGHMRLITGYNEKTEELIYTDSWGAGHEKKRMPMADAFCMTTALLVMPPTK